MYTTDKWYQLIFFPSIKHAMLENGVINGLNNDTSRLIHFPVEMRIDF